MNRLNTLMTVPQALIVRLATGGLFGLALAFLAEKFKNTPPDWVGVSMITLALSAFILWAGAGVMRRLSLGIWYLIAAVLIAFVAWHQIHQDNIGHAGFVTMLLLAPFAFISHELVSSADMSLRMIAPYETYFDEAWKRGVQVVLSFVFTGLMWAILGLGALLLGFIGIKWFGDLLINKYFAVPITGMALGAAFHLGDVRARLLSSVRALILGVLAWLLPVLTIMGALFIAGLMVKGMNLLWATKAATFTLLLACVKFVLLINAAYQKGESDETEQRKISIILKVTVRIACALLLVFAALAAYSLALRVRQYGLTPERVMAGIGVAIACLYALGYGVSAVIFKGRWMHPLEKVNVIMAFVMVILFYAVMTPPADPRRLSTLDQVWRLTSGKVKPDHFDWYMLRYDLGQYGADAIKMLKTSKDPVIRDMAIKAEQGDAQRPAPDLETPKPRPDLGKLQIAFPKGAKLPESFVRMDFRGDTTGMPDCLLNASKVSGCWVGVLDVDGDGTPEVLILDENRLNILDEVEGRWMSKTTDYLSNDSALAFKAGKITLKAHRFIDVKIGDSVTSYDAEPKGSQARSERLVSDSVTIK